MPNDARSLHAETGGNQTRKGYWFILVRVPSAARHGCHVRSLIRLE